jgi:UDP-N-acetylmuramate dehydrogenase
MQDLDPRRRRARVERLEHFIGIPSTVGGAVWQNLHFLSPAPERERTVFIAEVFERCDILSEENERRTVGADYVRFGYDDTVFHHRRDVVLSATFRLAAATWTACTACCTRT